MSDSISARMQSVSLTTNFLVYRHFHIMETARPRRLPRHQIILSKPEAATDPSSSSVQKPAAAAYKDAAAPQITLAPKPAPQSPPAASLPLYRLPAPPPQDRAR